MVETAKAGIRTDTAFMVRVENLIGRLKKTSAELATKRKEGKEWKTEIPSTTDTQPDETREGGEREEETNPSSSIQTYMSDHHTVTPTVTNMTTSEIGEVASTSPYTLDLNPMEEIDSNQEQPPTTPIKERTTDAYGMVSSTVSPLVDGGGSVSATPPPCDLDDFSPVLSKSARRRQARKIGAEARARQIASHTGGGGGHRTGGSGSGSGSGSVQFRHSTSAYELSNPSVASVPSHMLVHHSPYHRVGGRHGIIVQLKDMFPSIEEDVLESLYSTFGSFDGVVEYMLQHEAAESHHEKQLAAALHASTLESQGVVSSASPFVSGSGGWSAIASGAPPLPSSPSPSTPLLSSTSPPFAMSTSSSPLLAPTGVDRLSPLTVDLFYPICDHLDLFDLANLCGTNHEIQRQVDTVLHRVDGLDFSKQRYGHWTDRRMLGMISRFPSTTSLSFRNTEFRSFDQLHRHCFGSSIRHLSVAGCLALEDYHLTELFELGDHLTSLDLTQTEVTDDGLDYIATARTNKVLEKLALTGCKFTSSMGIQRILDRCKSLRQLDLKGTNVTKSALTFQQQSQLQSINLSTCRRLPAEFSITSEFCRLVAINLSSNPSLKNVTLVIPTLTQLNLSNSKHLQTLTLHTPKLTLLNLNGCLVLSKIAPYVPYSATFLSAISTLNTNGCRSITGLSFDRLFQSSKTTLTSLTCRGCLLLTDANLALLLRDDKSESSSLQVDDSSLVLSNPSHCQLVFLDLSGCKAASSSVIMTLQRQVAAHQSYLHQQAQLEATKSTLPTSAGFGNFSSSPDHEVWAGGLDDEEYDENEDSSEESGNSGALSEAML